MVALNLGFAFATTLLFLKYCHLGKPMKSKTSLEELVKLVDQRSYLWKRYDEAKQQEKELDKYAGQFSSSSSSQNLPKLSNTKTPPDEVAEAVWQIKQEADKIGKAKSRIQSCQEGIKKTEREFFALFGIGIVSILIVLIVVLNR